MARAALHDGTTVVNVIVVDPAADYTAPDELTLVELADDSPIGPRWRLRGGEFIPPPVHSLTIAPDTVAPDGADVAVATYTDTRDQALAEVAFDVNGATATEGLVDGRASIEITAAAPGPIVVRAGGLTATIQAQEVQP